ncbi:MAG: hypothetical protein OEW75_03785 [Cyclobacteriaceae bacterium]|nr:hypothetical protein [Cyclobacteriaceae bacterium]
MPEIGRFFNVDPLADKYVYNSPYAFSENKVTSHVELEGLESYKVTNYSKVQTEKLQKQFDEKTKTKEGGVDKSETAKMNKTLNEINRITFYGMENGFSDDYMSGRLEESGIDVPDKIKDGEATVTLELIDPDAEFSVEFQGVIENDEGNLSIETLGEVNSEDSEKNTDWGAVGETVGGIIIDIYFFIQMPLEIFPIFLPPEPNSTPTEPQLN